MVKSNVARNLIVAGIILIIILAAEGYTPSTASRQIVQGINDIFGSSILVGSTGGTMTLENGTSIQLSWFPVDQVSFKMSLNAYYDDGTNATIYEKSSLPKLSSLALVGGSASIGGKKVKHVDAIAVVAINSSRSLPSTATAHFLMNFTACIHELNTCKWFYRDLTSPLVKDGTLAIAVLPPLSILPEEVFGDNPTSQKIRRVDWTVTAQVSVTAPGYQPLSLTGGTGSFLDWHWDPQTGSLVLGGACTDCGTPTTPSVPSTPSEITIDNKAIIGGAEIDEEPAPPTPDSCTGAGCSRGTATVTTIDNKAIVSFTIDSIGTVDIKDLNMGIKDRVAKQAMMDREGRAGSSGTGRSGGTGGPAGYALIPVMTLAPLNYDMPIYITMGDTTALINPTPFVVLLGLLAVGILYLRSRKR